MKNLIVYELPEDFYIHLIDEQFTDSHIFKPCGPLSKSSMGFVPNIFGSFVEPLSGGVLLLTVRHQKKTPSKSHIDYLVQKEVDVIKERSGVVPSKYELEALRDDATAVVLKETFPNTPQDIRILIKGNKLFFEVASCNKAQEYFLLLEKLLDKNIPYSHPEVDKVDVKFKNLIIGEVPEPFVLGNSTKLIDNDGRITTISKGDVEGSAAENLVVNGADVELLELDFDGIISFKVKQSLEISGIKYSKDMLSEVKEDGEGTTLLQVREIVRMYETLITVLKIGDV